ncbi:hypothetical protein BC938DRAFT_472154 [Jimgerdemannia flammicorona]|uniref:HMA domain-containing protein n=1 Tax=Jimgerdemannia flammicorona TaxID=994334 RepID=A0A433Q6N6_9FUNG|nr:hypothetical protein BC938DRAFT_472154 [Jimgerdemannia flammicorona]
MADTVSVLGVFQFATVVFMCGRRERGVGLPRGLSSSRSGCDVRQPLDPIVPFQQWLCLTSSVQTYKFNVGMTCGGCSNAVNRALTKLDGTCLPCVSKVDISLETQIVEVQATIPQADVLEAIKKTGKPVTPL